MLTIYYLFLLPISSLLHIFITDFLTGFSALTSIILYFPTCQQNNLSKYFNGSPSSTGSSLNPLSNFIIYFIVCIDLPFWPRVPPPFLDASIGVMRSPHTPCSFTSSSCNFHLKCSLLIFPCLQSLAQILLSLNPSLIPLY